MFFNRATGWYAAVEMRIYKFISAEFALNTLSTRRLKITTLDELNDPFELLPFDLRDRKSRLLLRLTKHQIGSNRGLLCFSSNWQDPVLWAHYATQHRGICIGFDVPDGLCRRVDYVNHRLPFPDLRSYDEIKVAEAMLFTKFINWQYEKEVRIWLALSEKEDGRYYAPFDNTLKPAVVIVGAQCNEPRNSFERALNGLGHRVALIKARPGFGAFEIVTDKRGFRLSVIASERRS